MCEEIIIEAALKGMPVAWFSPTYKMLSEAWRDLKGLLQPVTARALASEHRLELVTGGVIDMWSLDAPDSARGRKYGRVVVDEAAMIAGLEDAFNAVIRPTLTDLKGDAWLPSTPKGMNFFWKAWTWGQDPNMPDWASWQLPTIANPYIDPEEVEAARLMLPERIYQQEYLATFLEEAGGVFRGVSECIDKGRGENEAYCRDLQYSLGVDLARVEDFTVLTVLDNNGRQVYFERFNQISWERQIAAIERVAMLYHARITMDSTGVGDPIFEAIRMKSMAIEGFQITGTTKEPLINELALAIEQQSIRLMDIPTQTNELQAYQYELTPSRNVRMNAPQGMHDDAVIALALAKHGIIKSVGSILTGGKKREAMTF